MSMFKGQSPDSGDLVTVVGPEAYFHGAMTVRGSIRIEGKVEGDIMEASTVVIGPTGRVRGNVAADHVVVGGHVYGDVIASSSLELKAGGRVAGNIRTPKLLIEEGAVFDGACAMTERPAGPAPDAHEPVSETAAA